MIYIFYSKMKRYERFMGKFIVKTDVIEIVDLLGTSKGVKKSIVLSTTKQFMYFYQSSWVGE